jgi:hypothetical protein
VRQVSWCITLQVLKAVVHRSPLLLLPPLLLLWLSAGCGSCWAFAATALTEAASFAQTGTVVSLSEKQVLDCASGTFGCDGGYATAALDYIVDAGLTTSTQYPYVSCK